MAVDFEIKFLAFHKNPPVDDSCLVRVNFDLDIEYNNDLQELGLSHTTLTQLSKSRDGLDSNRFLAFGRYSTNDKKVSSWDAVNVFLDDGAKDWWKRVIEIEINSIVIGSKLERSFNRAK